MRGNSESTIRMKPPTPTDDPTPRTATRLLGHEAAEKQFLDAWNGGRLSHAWLIAGPKGIGKATLAYRIARFVLASGGGAGDGGLFGAPPPPASLAIAPEHPVFRRVASGGHADLRVIERPEAVEGRTKRPTEIPVDAVRTLGGFFALTPGEGGWRVVIIDAIDELNRSGANAILKLLEEPPTRSLLLLVCHSPGRILPTIRSRCRRLTLKPLDEAIVVELLRQQRPALPPEDAAAIARLAEGSIGNALALHAQGGLELYRAMIGLLSGLPRLDVPALHGFAQKATSDEDAARTTFALFLRWLTRAATASREGGAGGGDAVAGESELGRRLVAAAGLDRWLELWDKTTRSFGRAEAVNLDRRQVVLNAFLSVERCCRP